MPAAQINYHDLATAHHAVAVDLQRQSFAAYAAGDRDEGWRLGGLVDAERAMVDRYTALRDASGRAA